MLKATRPVDSRHNIRCAQAPRVGQKEEPSTVHVLHRPPEGMRLSGPLPFLESSSNLGYPYQDDLHHPPVP